LKQTIKSTGDASGLTAKQMEELAEKEMSVSTFSKDEIESGESVLATFTKIGKNVFPMATQAVLDFAQKMGTSPKQAALTLGKALNDPATGLTKLTRVGITFTDAQKKQITAMEKAGNVAGAQKIIIDELNKKYGGQASAAADTFSGKQKQLANQFKEIKESIGNALLPILEQLGKYLVQLLQPIAKFVSEHPKIAAGILSVIAVLGTALGGLSAVNNVLGIFGKSVADIGLQSVASFGLVGAAIAGVAVAAALIITHWEPIKAFFINLWNGVKSTTESVWNSIKTFLLGIWNGIKETAQSIWNGIVTAVMAIVSPFIQGITNLFDGMKTGLTTIMGGLKEYFSGIWLAIKTVILGPVLLILDLVTGNFTKLSTDAQGIFNNLKSAFSSIWNGIKQIFTGTIQTIAGFCKTEWTGIVNIGETVWNGFKGFFTSLWNGLVSFITGLPGKFVSGVSNIGNAIIHGFDSAINFIKNLPSKMLGWGKDMIQGLIDGIKSMIGSVGDAVSGVANKIRSFLHFSKPDEGPLSDADKYGLDFMELLQKTIEDNADKPAEAAKKVAQLVSDRIQSVKDTLAKQIKSLNSELSNINQEEKTALNGKKGAQRSTIEDEYNKKKQTIKDEISLRKEQADKEIAEIKRIGNENKDELNQEIQDRKDFISNVNSLDDQIKNALKEEYTEDEKSQEDHLNTDLDKLDKWKDKSETYIDDVYSRKEQDIEDAATVQENALQAELNAMDKQAQADTRAQEKQNYDTQATSLQDKISHASDPLEKFSYEQQLNKLNADRQKQLNDEATEVKKASLQQQIQDIKTNADKQKQILENEKQAELNNITSIYNAQKDSLDAQKKYWDTFYQNKLSDANLEAESEKLIMQKNQTEIVKLLNSYGDQYKQAGQTLGDRLAEGFQPAIENIKAMISSITASISQARDNALNAMATAVSINQVPALAIAGSNTTTKTSTTTVKQSISVNIDAKDLHEAAQVADIMDGFAQSVRKS
jgi:phage-related protein